MYSESSLEDQHCTTGYRLDSNGTLVPILGACFIGAKLPGEGTKCVLHRSSQKPELFFCTCVGDLCNHPQNITVPAWTNLTASCECRVPHTPHLWMFYVHMCLCMHVVFCVHSIHIVTICTDSVCVRECVSVCMYECIVYGCVSECMCVYSVCVYV